jgi:cell division protein ZapA
MSDERQQAVSVEIYDQVYHLRGTDPKHIEMLAALVDGKMRAVAATGSTVDSLRVAVLAALNISDELLNLRARYDALAGSVGRNEDNVRSLAGMLDEVLEDRRAG